jgi:enoyl-CoA hydratase/carnithine racemase
VPRFGFGKIDESSSDEFERTVDELEALRVPTIAALNGSVDGGSTDLALACDSERGACRANAGIAQPSRSAT